MPKIKAGKRVYHGDKAVLERIRERFSNPFARLDYPADLTPEEAAVYADLFPKDLPRPEPTPAELAAENESTLEAYAVGQARGCIGASSVPHFQAEIDRWAEEHSAEIEAAVKPCRDPQGSKVIHVVHGDEK